MKDYNNFIEIVKKEFLSVNEMMDYLCCSRRTIERCLNCILEYDTVQIKLIDGKRKYKLM